jgi:hypothetical protein
MLNKKTCISALLFWVVAAAHAGSPAVDPNHPDSYTVVKGDTLWSIADRFLTEPWRWPEIWQGNPQIEDPHLIFPGDVITLTWEDGEPVLSVAADTPPPPEDRTVVLMPEMGIEQRGDRIQEIPLGVIQIFLSQHKLFSKEEYESWPYVVANDESSVMATIQQIVYVRGIPQAEPGDRYTVYRIGSPYRTKSPASAPQPVHRPSPREINPLAPTAQDPQPNTVHRIGSPHGINPPAPTPPGSHPEGRLLGHEGVYVGEVVVKRSGDPAEVQILKAKREVLEGDRLLEIETDEADQRKRFLPRPPYTDVDGNIVSIHGDPLLGGDYQIVVLDVGDEQGLEVGNVLGIYSAPKEVGDRVRAKQESLHRDDPYISPERSLGLGFKTTLPENRVGVLIVFRTYEKLSYALVMEATEPIRQYQAVRNM